MPAAISKIQRLNARLRGTAAETIPVRYDIECDCGCQVSGQRGNSSKQVDCPECHATLFILPTNVYPATASVESDVIGGSFANRLRVVLTEALPLGRSQPVAPPRQRTKSKPEKSESSQPAPRRWSIPRPSIPRINPLQLVRRIFSPLRLLALGMVLLVGVTSYWMYQNSAREEAKQIWHETTDAIDELIVADDFEQLQEALQAATLAGQRIGEQGPEWRRIRNLLQETQAVSAVSYETLSQLMSDLAAVPVSEDRQLGGLESALLGSVFFVDGYIDPSGRTNREFTVDVPVMSGETPVMVSLRLPQLAEFLEQNSSARVVCAFRVSEIGISGGVGGRGGWRIEIAPESFVLMTSEQHCRRLGFSVVSDPSLAEVLTVQKTFVEESDAWATRQQPDGQSGFAFLVD